jgi:transposase-like protein
LEPIIRASIEKGSNVYTDEWYRHNNNLSKNFNHEMVNHGKKQYVKEKVHTNTIENRWSHFKPMISGTYRWISRKHSQNYVNEFTLRNNTRKYSRQDRFNLVLSSMIGKHLTYQQLIN